MSPEEGRILAQIDELVAGDLLHSAELLCSLYLTSTTTLNNRKTNGGLTAKVLEKKGDILQQRDEVTAALQVYQQVDVLKKGILHKNCDEIKFKLAKCFMLLKDTTAALRELRQIPIKSRFKTWNSPLS